MSREFVLLKDYYEEGQSLYKKEAITIKPGVTVLVGCNGIGKTTLLHQMRDRLKKQNIPYIEYDNLHEGGKESISEAAFYENFQFMATAMQSSEGENIILNMNKLAMELGQFVKTGMPIEKNPFIKAFKSLNDTEDVKHGILPERWILLDAVDSGMSVDNIVDLKEELFHTIIQYNNDKEIYILISANEYELANGEQCFDVYNGRYTRFKDYEEYRNMILNSRKWKDKRNLERTE